ncbi:unnamed protein product [Cuscuta campestris]|uniref:CCHC-type domain-containing protein n=1 Tax=Cuscuta campestris TaxID=132261 RepID=A0A484NDU7_9ASTE|nr:unnamed protein product [Cuscuta campestris]
MTCGDSVRDLSSKFSKLEKFEGQDFRRWQKKMHFLLTTLKVVYLLSTPMPQIMDDETLEQTRKRCKWQNDDYFCRGHILNDKLPPSWKECKRELKHNKEEMNLVQLGTHLRIEESIRDQEGKKVKDIAGPSSINMVEDEGFTKVKNKSKGKKRKSGNTPKPANKKSKMGCWNCGKPGHFKQDCRIGKRDKDTTKFLILYLKSGYLKCEF